MEGTRANPIDLTKEVPDLTCLEKSIIYDEWDDEEVNIFWALHSPDECLSWLMSFIVQVDIEYGSEEEAENQLDLFGSNS